MNKKKILRELGRQLNMIVYEVDHVIYMRSKPAEVRQTKNTKSSAGRFREAVKLSALIRKALVDVISDPKDRKMIHHVDRQINTGLKQAVVKNKFPLPIIDVLQNLSLTPDIRLATRLTRTIRANWETSKGWIIQFPKINPNKHFSAPKGTHTVEIRYTAAICDMKELTVVETKTKTFEIEFDAPSVPGKTISIRLAPHPGHLSIVAVCLRFHTPRPSYGNRPAFRPAQVLGAFIA